MSENNLDRAQEVESIITEDAIARQRLKAYIDSTRLKPKGACYYCLEKLPDPLRFCDVDCRDDFDSDRIARERSGVK